MKTPYIILIISIIIMLIGVRIDHALIVIVSGLIAFICCSILSFKSKKYEEE